MIPGGTRSPHRSRQLALELDLVERLSLEVLSLLGPEHWPSCLQPVLMEDLVDAAGMPIAHSVLQAGGLGPPARFFQYWILCLIPRVAHFQTLLVCFLLVPGSGLIEGAWKPLVPVPNWAVAVRVQKETLLEQ